MGKDVDIPQGIGAIIEAPGFLPNFSGYRNLKFLADIRRQVGKERVRWAMETVGLDPDSPKHVGKYSLGMRQRLGLAQAILEDPDLLILDEPMNGLDKRGVEECASCCWACGRRERPSSWPATAARTSPCCATRSTKWTAAACSSKRKSRQKRP